MSALFWFSLGMMVGAVLLVALLAMFEVASRPERDEHEGGV